MNKKNNPSDNEQSLLEEIIYVLKTYFIGRIKISLILGILAFILLGILKIPYGAILSIIIAVFNSIPFIGALLSGFIIVLYTLIVEGSSKALWVLAVIILLQTIESLLLEPRILGRSFGLNPIFIFILVFFAGNIFGVLGMIFAVPIAVILRILLKKYKII